MKYLGDDKLTGFGENTIKTSQRVMHRSDLVDMAIRLRKSKDEMVKIAMVLDMDTTFQFEVICLGVQIKEINKVINSIDDKITAIDFPKIKK